MKFRGSPIAVAAVLAITALTAAAKSADRDVLRATLDNGLRVVIVRNTLAPVVTTEMNYLAGSDEVPDGFPGTAHAVEHMMFRGSPGLSKDQLSAIAANMGGAFNAATSQGVTRYYFVVPRENLDLALRIHAIRMRGVNFDAGEWKHERGAIEQEVSRDLSNPDFKFYTELQQRLFTGTPYAHTPLGTRASFDKTTARMLRHYHDTWYTPNNAILVIAGDVDPKAALVKVKRHFASIKRKDLPARPEFDFKPVRAHTVELPTDSPYGSVLLAYRMPGMRADDYAVAKVLAAALGSQRADLFDMGMNGTALFGGFVAQFMPHAGFGGAIGVFPRGGDPQPVLKHMRSILARAVAQGVSPALVAAAKQKAIAGLEFQKNSVAGLAGAWSQALALEGRTSPDAMKQALESVTPAQVNAMAGRLFDPAHAITAILTPQSSAKPTSGKGFGGAESLTSTPDKPVTLPQWAAEAFARLKLPECSLHPSSYTLDNGLRLIVQPEDVSDTVQLFGRIDSNQDMQAAKGQEGVADVLGRLFGFGTTHLDRLEFQQALDEISAHESAGTSFSLAVPADHFQQGMKLLADNELHPALPKKAFSIVQRQGAAATAGELQSPDFLTEIGIAGALLPKNDPGLRHATPESISGLSLKDVKAYRAQVFRPDLTTIVVVGKVQPQQARRIVARYFGAWKASGPTPEPHYPAVPLNKPAQLHVPDSSAVQDSVILSQLIDVDENSPQRFALQLGNEVLGGGFYASRLYRDLREKTGLVYNVSTQFDLDRHRGTYSVSYGSDPDKVAAAHARIVHDLKAMQTTPVSASELTRAKGILLRGLPLSQSSFDGIGGQLLGLSLAGKPLDEPTIAARQYLKMTAADVQSAYKHHIRPDAFVTAVKGPKP